MNLGAGTNEDWVVLLNRAACPIVMDADAPQLEVQLQQAGSSMNLKLIARAYVALGVSRRPEGLGVVKGFTVPSY